jgi:hypothetical protein
MHLLRLSALALSTALSLGAAPLALGAGAPADAAALAPVRPGIYAPVRLTADLAPLSAREREMVGLFIDAATIMDDLFWTQAYPGNRQALLDGLKDPAMRRFAEVNYGPWDRLAGNAPFVPGAAPKPPGAGFYPLDMTREEFERANLPGSRGEYTVLRRGENGALEVVPYSVHWRAPLERAAGLLERAAGLAAEPGLRRYLELRARALRTDDYRASDMAWLDMKDNRLDLVIGPIETYEDRLYGYKAAFEAFVLVKDLEWSRRLARYAAMLPALQRGLPVPEAYKAETPGTDSDLNAYDVVYYAGDCNAGSKTIAINLPNDEQVQLEKGTRRLQLKNAMRAKFDAIMVPIAAELMAPEQRRHVTFDAFFANTMFHEVAHGLGIKNTVNGRGTVRDALKELGSGVASAHGQANMVRFNFFADRGAFARDAQGHYRVDMPAMRRAVDELSGVLLRLQGDGDTAGVQTLTRELGVVRPQLQADLDRLSSRSIPVDVVFTQGKAVLGLE